MTEKVVDLGCGANKTSGSFGVDIHPFPGVDLVTSFDSVPWPIEGGRFDRIICRQIMEHVMDPVSFMSEIHRIARSGALVQVVTPHYSSIFSWSDPTHLRHLSLHWYKPFLAGAYLVSRSGAFELVSSRVTFGGSIKALTGKVLVKLLGQDRWERDFAFVYPGRDIETTLKAIK